jgi:chaperonin GroEL (HSP60 family)
MMTREVTVTVREYGYGADDHGYPPHNLKEAIAAFQEALSEIPEALRDNASIDFDPYWSHGETFERVRITYERPEAAEETASRVAEERAAMIEWIEEQKALIRRRKAELEIA